MTCSLAHRLTQLGKVLLSGLALSMAAAMPAAAQSAASAPAWPNKPIRLVVGFAAGGVTEIMGRALAQRLSAQLNNPVYVDVRTGADSLLASQNVARSEPDGYTLYFASAAHAVNQHMFKKSGIDAVADFSIISMYCDIPNVIAVNSSLPVKNLQEFIAYAKARKGQMNYSTSASGTFLATELFLRSTGIDLQRVPYKGAAPGMMALLANDVQLIVTGIGTVTPYLDTNKIRVLAIASEQRSVLAPNVPTAIESGVPNHTTSTWYALIAPPKMPRELVTRLNAETRKALADPEFVNSLIKLGAVPQPTTPAEAEAFIRSEVEKWRKVIVATNSQVSD
jgi:tripartite-type tricarboxylate transporter receptor subunit TctC